MQMNKREQWRLLQAASDHIDNGQVNDAIQILTSLKVSFDPNNLSEAVSTAIRQLGLGRAIED